MEKVRVVIPIYKQLDDLEIISVKRCFEVLDKYPITFIGPENFDFAQLKRIASIYRIDPTFKYYAKSFFKDIHGYNKLMLSPHFYKSFIKNEYILIYQTDSFVFKDDLAFWCSLGYDYIGAPWPFDVYDWVKGGSYPKIVKKYYKIRGAQHVSTVGNGGLSLRKTRSLLNNLSFLRRWVDNWVYNEDMFISHCIKPINPFFKIPSPKIAMKFSFDIAPSLYYKLNDQQLPFGCHGWFRDDEDYSGNKQFYSSIIESFH